jgi:hypothetical protein
MPDHRGRANPEFTMFREFLKPEPVFVILNISFSISYILAIELLLMAADGRRGQAAEKGGMPC